MIASAADNSPQVIEITFEVEEAPPGIRFEPETVGFAAAEATVPTIAEDPETERRRLSEAMAMALGATPQKI